MSSDFGIAVQVTIVGMALVFLTLIICALVISALNRVFKPKPEEAQEEKPAASPALPLVSVTAPGVEDADEAAAIAVAIALARRAALQPQRLGASFLAPAMSRVPQASADEEIVGEVVTVLSVDPGPATWSGYGRIQAMR